MMPMQSILYTIGHSNHELSRFMDLLGRHAIAVVADVRSRPYSQFSPHFNREDLEFALKAAEIQYTFMGEELGARRGERECYVDGTARYDRIAALDAFQRGLQRVRRGALCQRIALMCSEKDPLECHRAILVCRLLRGGDLAIRHILENGSLLSQEELESKLLSLHELPAIDLFHTPAQLVEQAYDLQAEQIAFVEELAPG
jgi:uncharacterized protein (DUF488 family)